MKINFRQFGIFTDIRRKAKRHADVREQFGNIIYQHVQGVAALSLATKIYESDGEAEYTDAEAKLIMQVAEQACTAVFIDSLKSALADNKEQKVLTNKK